MIGSDGLQHRSSWPINNSISLPPSYLSSMSSEISPYPLTPSGYQLQHSADAMVRSSQHSTTAEAWEHKIKLIGWVDD